MIPGQSAGSPCGLPAGGLASERRVQARENGRMLGMATRQANKPASRQRAGSRPRPGHVLMSPGTGHRGSSSRRCGIALAGVGNGMIHGFEGRRRNKTSEGMKKKPDGEGLLTSILCDANDGLATVREASSQTTRTNQGVKRPKGSPRPQTSRDWRQTGLVRPVPGPGSFKRRRDRGLMSVGEAPGKAGE